MPKGRIIYRERATSFGGSVGQRRTVVFYENGSWVVDRRTGCLPPGHTRHMYIMSKRARAVIGKRVRPQPCAAAAKRSVEAMLWGKRLRWVEPCGPNVPPMFQRFRHELFKATRGGTAAVGSCSLKAVGTPVYRRWRVPYRRGPVLGRTAPMLRVFADGTWIRGRGTAKGCLNRRDMARLRRMTRRTTFGLDPVSRPTCRAMPRWRHHLQVAGKPRVNWASPCSRGVHPSLAKLMAEVNRLAK